MQSRTTPEQKAEALRLVAEVGLSEAARRTGIKPGTLSSWCTRNGVRGPNNEAMQPAIQASNTARAETMLQRKQALAEGLLDDVAKLRAELFASTLERKVVIVKGGTADPCTVAEIVDVKHARPSAADQRNIMVACAVAIDKVQILTGGLTASIGVTEAPEPLGAVEERQRALQAVDELARRRLAS